MKLDARTGLRVEKSAVNLLNSFSKPVLAFLPYTNLKYKLTSKQNIQLSYSRIIRRPNIYQLNPYVAVVDPFTVNAGNPGLKPEYLTSVFLDHSLQFKSNYFSSCLFLDRATNVINNLTYINNSGNLATRTENPGTLQHFGIQFSGSFKVSILTLNPYLKIFEIFTLGNKLAKQYSIENKIKPGLGLGLSAIIAFKHNLSYSMSLHYDSPSYAIQTKNFSDLNYFLSLEKAFKKNIKVGIASAIPFCRSFTYQGSEILGKDFYSYTEGNIQLSMIPVWFRLHYQFSSGRKRDSIERSKEVMEDLPKKGF